MGNYEQVDSGEYSQADLTPIQWAVGSAIMFGDDTLTMTAGQARALTERIGSALRALPVKARMDIMGMQAVGWTYDNDPSGYFCGGPSNDYDPNYPHVYVEHDVAMRKENCGG